MSQVDAVMSPEMATLKAKHKDTWEAGDYGHFARYLLPGALEFLDRLQLAPGTRLLDVGCGAGQLVIPAAEHGVDATGLDLSQKQVDDAKRRVEEAGLNVEIRQGDAEALPFPDASFDVVMSLIGSMFAPRPELVASEMLRVCRPGGKLVMGNWTPEGRVGEMFRVVGKHAPPRADIPSPLLWGTEAKLRERFGRGVSELRITRYLYPLHYPFPPAEVATFFVTYYGPTFKAFHALQGDARDAFMKDFTAFWTEANEASDGTTEVLAEYVDVIGTRAEDRATT